MKKTVLLAFALLLAGCAAQKETYPYGLSETEWKSLSIRDQTKLRRDFYFYEKGETSYVNPSLEIEGKEGYAGTYQGTYRTQTRYQEQSDYQNQ